LEAFHGVDHENLRMADRARTPKGRSAAGDPPNRFLSVHREADPDAELDAEDDERPPRATTQFFSDLSETIVTENNSPDVPFRYSVNPYRGCEHGCSYCYARPSHEYLGLGAGLDFESKIFVKERAPELLAQWLARDTREPEMICFSGITDCYQPAERTYELTRRCLQVAAEAGQPVGIITKNRLVTRDLDVLVPMARRSLVHVSLSITTLDEKLARRMEPRTSRPSGRLEAIRELTAAGVPTRVMIAPIIPGLNDSEIPQILKAAQEAGAGSAGHVLLRLSGAVRPVFLEWLSRCEPTRAARVEAAIRQTRAGKLNDTQFGRRMRGTGTRAEQIDQTFATFAKRLGLDRHLPSFDFSQFQPPRSAGGQLRLF
jgi:DNA repair photolyase